MPSQFLPRFVANMTPRAILDALNRLVDAVAEIVRIRSVAAPLNVNTAGTLSLNDYAYRRIPARLTAVNGVSVGTGVPQYRYAFKEQIFDPAGGVYSDLTNGLVGDGAFTYATEVNNQYVALPVAASSPSYPAGSGPLVWLRGKGNTASGGNNYQIFEFDIYFPTVLAVVNSAMPNLLGYYDGTLRYFDGTSYQNGPNVWLKDFNG